MQTPKTNKNRFGFLQVEEKTLLLRLSKESTVQSTSLKQHSLQRCTLISTHLGINTWFKSISSHDIKNLTEAPHENAAHFHKEMNGNRYRVCLRNREIVRYVVDRWRWFGQKAFYSRGYMCNNPNHHAEPSRHATTATCMESYTFALMICIGIPGRRDRVAKKENVYNNERPNEKVVVCHYI